MDANTNDELVDIVDDNDGVFSSNLRRNIVPGFRNYRVVNAFVVNNDNKILVPKRAKTKKSFPGALDFSVGGHVKSGESYEDALGRECKEELNICIGKSNFAEVLYLNPYEYDVSSFMKVWVIKYSEPIKRSEDEFESFEWNSINELEKRIINGEYAKDDVIKVINILRRMNLTIASTG